MTGTSRKVRGHLSDSDSDHFPNLDVGTVPFFPIRKASVSANHSIDEVSSRSSDPAHGLMTTTPVEFMSASFRVTTAQAWILAVAAMRASMAGIGRPRRSALPSNSPHSLATYESTSRIRSLNRIFRSSSIHLAIVSRRLELPGSIEVDFLVVKWRLAHELHEPDSWSDQSSIVLYGQDDRGVFSPSGDNLGA